MQDSFFREKLFFKGGGGENKPVQRVLDFLIVQAKQIFLSKGKQR
jgi:hypothetical protein